MPATDILTPSDPLLAASAPERVNYATGVLLAAEDFRDEQTYHRSRLASALHHIVGFGTLAGLAVRAPQADDSELHLQVEPGLALDRYGRLIEVGEPWCIRLQNWMLAFDAMTLLAATTPKAPDSTTSVLCADLFLSARDCGRGKTPSFASGPFDALDALVPARLAEEPQFELVLRMEGAPDLAPLPERGWPDTTDRNEQLEAVLGSWSGDRRNEGDGTLVGLREHVAGHDASAIYLARITIPVTLPPADAPAGTLPGVDAARRTAVDNSRRPFVWLPGRWLGFQPKPAALVEP